MLPRPNLSFTLPSIHDNTKLDCRIYHPKSLDGPLGPSDESWRRHAAVVAHPYAPLGGSYDDPIVQLVASTLVHLGFVVATFNFRGASSSGSHTSWTSRPERADYMSVAGFLIHYVHYLRPHHNPRSAEEPLPTLLFAGYSYGAMVTMQLPSLDSYMPHFASPAAHTASADIRLRAQHLAEQQVLISATPASPRRSLGVRVGGDEDTSLQKDHRKQRSRSPDREERIRKGVRDILSRSKLIRRRHHKEPPNEYEVVEHECLDHIDNLAKFRSAYLLVSPPLGLATNLATMSFSNPLSGWSKRGRGGSSSSKDAGDTTKREEAEAEMKLTANPTLTVYGDRDGFLTLKKMRDWTTELGSTEGSLFHHVEVPGAGHFWVEEDVIYELREAVLSFAKRLIQT
ncbi:Alpha/Beta hydrolase protein [Hypoxylon trugodes]|uniref:Alpha/Beta hydrolase protein n=1 Tax=Hypoxylon trugodes TaxID=326681 RepID=UPI0021A1A522|nr:Alpha/Beta hydrolase protein [Hypoxylon trugodes]KAI1383962.1 Alpha/Beta hydrolase protein [Hypoxylon trugodes]